MSPRYLIPMLLSLMVLHCGCSRQQTVSSTTTSHLEAVVTRPRTESFPHIRAVTPEEVPFTDDKVIDLRLVTERRAPDWTPKHHSYLDVKADIRLIPVLDQ